MEKRISVVYNTIEEIYALVKKNLIPSLLEQSIQDLWYTRKRPSPKLIKIETKEETLLKVSEKSFPQN